MAVAKPASTDRPRRSRVLKGGTILTDVNESEIKVTIRNMHDTGAELRLPHGVGAPSDFLLYVPVDGVAYRAHVRWRNGERIGVAFSGTEPKPRWHYG